jgi:hypothetical protein
MGQTDRTKVIITATEVIFPRAAKPRNGSRIKPPPRYFAKAKTK